MGLLEYFAANHDHFFYTLAGLSFIVELTLMGLSGPLLFFAIGSFITAILINVGLIAGWEIEIFVLGVLTGLITMALWKPLKNFQNSGGGADSSSDMIGRQVAASTEITATGGSVRYSGIDWNSRLASDSGASSIAQGDQCLISSVDGNVMLVKPLTP
jgi:inner membrane protein